MSDRKRAARGSGNYSRATSQEKAASGRSKTIVADYGRGALIAGLITAVSFGLMFVHAAVVM